MKTILDFLRRIFRPTADDVLKSTESHLSKLDKITAREIHSSFQKDEIVDRLKRDIAAHDAAASRSIDVRRKLRITIDDLREASK